MSTMTRSRAGQILHRASQIWGELDYAQRRLMEIRTGVPQRSRRRRPATGATVRELEALFALDQHDQSRDGH